MVAKLAVEQLADWSAQDRADYAAHSNDIPLHSIRNDAELDRALAKITALIDAAIPSLGSERYLDALSDLVSVYEARTVHFPRLPGVEILRHLMAEHGLQQQDLVNLFGSKSVVSEVLSGKRQLALHHIARLSEYFGVPADAFIDRPARHEAATAPPGTLRAASHPPAVTG